MIKMQTKHHHLRELLKELEVIERSATGDWIVRMDCVHIATQSSCIKEAGCEAAEKVLTKRLGHMAKFSVTAWLS